ncbi:MAG: hypothetical protein ACRDUY_08700 [Nitriliruptorales bacterium]
MPFDDALEALGEDGEMGRRTADVPIANIVGSMDRARDFDEELRLVNPALRERWDRLASAVRSGFEPPPVTLVQLGELYFVLDGHHRISVARSLGRVVITARVGRICTIAYAKSCLRAAHLPTKAAERRFLERVPLPDEVRRQLWLDEPSQWSRLADTAEAWGMRRSLERDQPMDRCELAARWWTEEVEPLVARLRCAGVGLDLRDVQLFVTALAVRDRLGGASWPPDIVDRLRSGRVPEPVGSAQ